ncbi:hypothetical protein [Devosia sp. FJ2-5-3]|jgi:hypothetical protein|uniref:hypothetical protein n=1 Tax=Devosia sp. FJ2-5-3 TaxID=2976680 RepID=UPI0023D7DFCC|nr:hypothetical protein [Devosia sp. FJ2-5-3]WEJ59627.1 hypothetical protein N0P34_06275 [Devosia sp. FJ2-5-3]
MIPASYLFKTIYHDTWDHAGPEESKESEEKRPPRTGHPISMALALSALNSIFRRQMVTFR